MKPSLVAALGAGVAIPAFGLFLRIDNGPREIRKRASAATRRRRATPGCVVRGPIQPIVSHAK